MKREAEPALEPWATSLKARQQGGSTALMYHGVHHPPRGTYDVSVAAFERQLATLSRKRIISLRSLSLGGSGVALTFDDGDASCLWQVAPRLSQRGWPAIVFVTTGFLGRPGFIAPSDVPQLTHAGFSVGAHGHTHRLLTELNDADVRDELRRSKGMLEDITGKRVSDLALPGGAGDSRIRALAVEAGFELLATSWPARGRRRQRPLNVPRIALTRETSDEEFRRILDGCRTLYASYQARAATVSLALRLLGRERYELCRAAIRGPRVRSREAENTYSRGVDAQAIYPETR